MAVDLHCSVQRATYSIGWKIKLSPFFLGLLCSRGFDFFCKILYYCPLYDLKNVKRVEKVIAAQKETLSWISSTHIKTTTTKHFLKGRYSGL